jgi:hypothetical protein
VPLKNSPRGARDGPNPKDIRYTVFNRIERKTKNLSERVREHRSTVVLKNILLELCDETIILRMLAIWKSEVSSSVCEGPGLGEVFWIQTVKASR